MHQSEIFGTFCITGRNETMRCLICNTLLLTTLIPNNAIGQDLVYFSKDIDYWHDSSYSAWKKGHKEGSQGPVQEGKTTVSKIRSMDSQPFNWNDYVSDRAIDKPSFWDDGGDYVPPRPFRELAANPTKENAKNFLQWLNNKNSAIEKVNKVLYENNENKYLPEKDNNININININKGNKTEENKINKFEKIDWNNVTVVYFYSSTCPHCKKEKSVIDYLIKLGTKITPIQIDYAENPAIYENSIPFDRKLASDFNVTSVPKIFLKYKNSVTVFEGETSFNSILESLNI